MNQKLNEKLSKHNLYVGKDGNIYLKKNSNKLSYTCTHCDLADVKNLDCYLTKKVGPIACGIHDYFKLVHKEDMEGV